MQRSIAICVAILSLTSAVYGQDPPPLDPPALPVVQKVTPRIVYSHTPARPIAGADVRRDDTWSNIPAVSVYPLGYGKGTLLSANASEDAIRRAAGLGVSLPAIPFDKKTAQRDDPRGDGSLPWLAANDVRAAWPKSLAFPANLRFYDLSRKYQNLYTMRNGSFKGRDITDLHDHSATLTVSGGMEGFQGWRSVKGMALPEGKSISVWEEDSDVRAFALVPRWRWSFPAGTVAYDVLLNGDSIFEVRTAEKTDDGEWAYRVAFKDSKSAPEGYQGVGRSCRSCHVQPGSIVDVPGRIYRHVVWGDDGRFSWRVFKDDGTLDTRWPIERR